MSTRKPSPIRAESVAEYAREVSRRETEDDLWRHIGGLKVCLDAEEWGNAADHADCVSKALRKLDAIEAAQKGGSGAVARRDRPRPLSPGALPMSADKQPKRVCVPCGNLYRLRPGTNACITVSMSECEVCGKQTMCAYAYDFGHLKPEWRSHRSRSEEQSP